jgi:hypothetical protein
MARAFFLYGVKFVFWRVLYIRWRVIDVRCLCVSLQAGGCGPDAATSPLWLCWGLGPTATATKARLPTRAVALPPTLFSPGRLQAAAPMPVF